MSRLSATDLVFLVAENQHLPLHMASCVVFEPPVRQRGTFPRKVFDALRASEVGEPFNRKLKWLDDGVARWETVQPDMNYHVRQLAVAAPGSTEQLDDLLAILNAPLMDRAYPLWQCFVIEGLEDGRFALFFKLHHALIDGGGTIKAFRAAMSDDPKDREIRAVWQPVSNPPKRKPSRVSRSQLQKFTDQLDALPSGVMDFASGLMGLGSRALGLKPGKVSLPYSAPDTPFNKSTTSSARCYGSCEIALDRVKAVAKASGGTVNDVVMTFVDAALHDYLRAHDQAVDRPLVSSMAFSIRTEGHGTGGNQVAGDLVSMGDPDADILSRLQQVHQSTTQAKGKAQKIPAAMRQLNSLLLFGAATIPEITPGMSASPSYNLLISNMVGPQEKLYLGGARATAFRGLPIVPPNPGLNVTFFSVHDLICLGVGATPETMPDTTRFIAMVLASFAELEAALIPKKKARKKSATARRPRKTASS